VSFGDVPLGDDGTWIPCEGSELHPVILLSEGWCPSCSAHRHQLYELDGRPGYCFTGDRWFRLVEGRSIGWIARRVVLQKGWPHGWRVDPDVA
jgi:hypothetical protein